MRKFLITGHGTIASGIKSSLDLIIGQTENVFVIDAYVNGNTTIEDELNTILKNMADDDEFIVFTDLMGGSITNQVLRFTLSENIHVVSGMNLPLVIEIVMADTDSPVIEIIESAIANAREQLTYVNKIITNVNDHD